MFLTEMILLFLSPNRKPKKYKLKKSCTDKSQIFKANNSLMNGTLIPKDMPKKEMIEALI